jgi:hypothetical protein
MAKKQDPDPMGNYVPKAIEYEAMMWCVKNGIRITPYPATQGTGVINWYLDIDIGGDVKRSPTTYKKLLIWKKLFELYRFYYNKHNTIHK